MSDILEDFAGEFDRCWLCGVMARNTWPPLLETHHIVRGPDRQKAKEERCALIRTCRRCHSERLNGMGVVRQLAIKWMNDRNGYDRVQVNTLRARSPEAITEGEVRAQVYELEGLAGGSGFPFPRWST
jgi:hypothetical protein